MHKKLLFHLILLTIILKKINSIKRASGSSILTVQSTKQGLRKSSSMTSKAKRLNFKKASSFYITLM